MQKYSIFLFLWWSNLVNKLNRSKIFIIFTFKQAAWQIDLWANRIATPISRVLYASSTTSEAQELSGLEKQLRNIQVHFFTLFKGCNFLIALVFCTVALSPRDELQCKVACQKTFVLMHGLLLTSLFFLRRLTIFQLRRRCRAKRRSVCLCTMFTSHLLCICLGCGRLLLTMETIISAITYPITVKAVHVLCVRTSWRDRNMENVKCTFHKWKSACVCGKPLVHHFSCDYHCTFCNQPAASLLLFK